MSFRFSSLIHVDLLTRLIDKSTKGMFFPVWLPALTVFHNAVKGVYILLQLLLFTSWQYACLPINASEKWLISSPTQHWKRRRSKSFINAQGWNAEWPLLVQWLHGHLSAAELSCSHDCGNLESIKEYAKLNVTYQCLHLQF